MNTYIWPINGTQRGFNTQGQSEPGSNSNEESIRHFLKRQDWSLAIKWFSVTSSTLIGLGGLPSLEMHFTYFITPADWPVAL